jgi:hypothetical protein
MPTSTFQRFIHERGREAIRNECRFQLFSFLNHPGRLHHVCR